MYVADVTDVKELLDLRAELLAERVSAMRDGGRFMERIEWDLEDIENRLWELGAK